LFVAVGNKYDDDDDDDDALNHFKHRWLHSNKCPMNIFILCLWNVSETATMIQTTKAAIENELQKLMGVSEC